MALLEIFATDDYDFTPSSLGEELFLSEVPQNLKLDAIENQFKDPMNENGVDYIQSWIRDYTCSLEEVVTDDEQTHLDEAVVKFIETVLGFFKKYLNLGFPDFDRLSESEQIETMHIVYRYFIINAKKNFNAIVMNDINTNSKKIASSLSLRNDIVSQTIPECMPDDIKLIIGNLGDVVNAILDKDWDSIDDFVTATWSDKTAMESDYVLDMIQKDRLTGNFITPYVATLSNMDRSNIISKTRKKLYKRHGKNSEKSIL